MSVEQTIAAANTGQDSISSLVQVKLRKNSVLSNIFTDVSSFANPGDKSISFPRWQNQFQVQKLQGAQKGDDQEAIFDLDKLELTEEAHIQWVIKKFDQARAKVAILSQAIDEATLQHALSLDTDIYNEFVGNIDGDNILAGSIDQDKIVDMITRANVVRMPAMGRSWLFGNNSYGTLLKIDGFVDSSKSNMEVTRTGQIGVLYGYPVFQSDTVGLGESFLVHNAALFYGFGEQPAVEDESAIKYGTGARRWVMDQLYGVKSVNTGKLVVSVGV